MKYYEILRTYDRHVLFFGKYPNFTKCLEDAVASSIDLNHADLRHKNLTNANLDGATMTNTNFSWANLSGANMSECALQESIFNNTALYNTCLCESNLHACDFRSASFGATDITGCDISHSLFSSVSCFSLDFWHTTNMDGCRYFNAEGQESLMSGKPIIVKGIISNPIIVLDQNIHIGHRQFPIHALPRLLTFLQSDHKTGVIT